MKKYFLSVLGCPKNQVDGEGIEFILNEHGFVRSYTLEDSDFSIVLSCGFIKPAKEESINEVLSICLQKEKNPEFKVILMGCLAERYLDELGMELLEVDGILGLSENSCIIEDLEIILSGKRLIKKKKKTEYCFDLPRINKNGFSRYVKIAEGCDNHCSYCAIPLIKGRLRSRTIKNIVSEIDLFAKKGAKEIILSAQDITAYGMDLGLKNGLFGLLKDILNKTNIEWLRLMYLHPAHFDDSIFELFSDFKGRLLPYFDLPIQHADTGILKKMNRGYSFSYLKRLIKKIRENIPEVIFRSTVMLGFPGEGEKEYERLYSFLDQVRLERVGFFKFSPEEGTKAYGKDCPDEDIVQARLEELISLQADISEAFNNSRLNKFYDVIIDEKNNEEDYKYSGRSYGEAPEIDPVILFNSRKKHKIGDIVKVKITDTNVFDIYGRAYS